MVCAFGVLLCFDSCVVVVVAAGVETLLDVAASTSDGLCGLVGVWKAASPSSLLPPPPPARLDRFELSLPPMTLFSPIIQPSPIVTGPSKARILMRGCRTLPAPMVTRFVPWKLIESGIVADELARTGGRETPDTALEACRACDEELGGEAPVER